MPSPWKDNEVTGKKLQSWGKVVEYFCIDIWVFILSQLYGSGRLTGFLGVYFDELFFNPSSPYVPKLASDLQSPFLCLRNAGVVGLFLHSRLSFLNLENMCDDSDLLTFFRNWYNIGPAHKSYH